MVMSRWRMRGILALAVSLCSLTGSTVFAQPQRLARVQITVVDETGGVIPDATVDIVGLEAATQRAAIATLKTNGSGIAIADGVAPGRYSVRAAFPGFDLGLIRDVRLNPGDNRRVVVLPLQKLQDSVTVAVDSQAAAADRRRSEFGLKLDDAQLQALSDDPNEMQRQIDDLAGPNAVVRVDSFEGQQLPPKAQIKSIHVVRDQFAAEAAQPGTTFVDVVTQPGIGPIRGSITATGRADSLGGRSQFTPERGPESFSNFAGNAGGTLISGKTSFSASGTRTNNTVTPILNVVLPSGIVQQNVNLEQPTTRTFGNFVVDHAITRDQTLRVGFNASRFNAENLGIGGFDLPERGFANDQRDRQLRIQEAGPIGRRTFINTRVALRWQSIDISSNNDLPTVMVEGAFNAGGAQQELHIDARNVNVASDVDYVRGIHSLRAGTQMDILYFTSNSIFNQRGTFTFRNLAAYELARPEFYNQLIGTPFVDYHDFQGALYVQDDIRVHRGLTFSPGVRYSAQSRVDDYFAFEPRFGVTWAPAANGRTTLRGSVGIFHNFLPPQFIEQTLRQDGVQQREIVLIDPSYPDPGIDDATTLPSSKYTIGDFNLQRNVRYSAGVDQVVSPLVRFNVLYNYIHQKQQPRGLNLNAPVDGVRPDPNFANVIEMVTDTQIRRHEVFANATINFAAPSPALQAARVNWRRLSVNASYSYIHALNNSGGGFTVSPSGDPENDWGPGPADSPYRVQFVLTSTQVRNLTATATYLTYAGFPYNWTTGRDDNADGFNNDRPAGVGLRALRGDRQETINARVAYTVNLRSSAAPAPNQPARYRVQLFTQMNNLTNYQNLTGYIGAQSSLRWKQPTAAVNLRRVDCGVTFNF